MLLAIASRHFIMDNGVPVLGAVLLLNVVFACPTTQFEFLDDIEFVVAGLDVGIDGGHGKVKVMGENRRTPPDHM
jgi:hypothetical protein